jgi:hypothetical protein
MSEVTISPKYHVGQTVYPDFFIGRGMIIEKVEAVTRIYYLADGHQWDEDELFPSDTDTALEEFNAHVNGSNEATSVMTFEDIKLELYADPETNAKIEAAKAELEQSTECEHTPFLGSTYTARLYHHKYYPDCVKSLETPIECNHAIGLAVNGGNDYPFTYCPDCGEKL